MPQETPPALRIEQASVWIRDGASRRTLLSGVSLAVPSGHVALVRGPSGAGKTTLLALAGLLLAPSEGEVWIEGAPTSRFRDSARAQVRRTCIGMVFQDFELISEVSVEENILLPAVPLGPLPKHRERAAALASEFGLGGRLHAQTSLLSGGERQRVALARALLMRPRLLLLDEPSAHLDQARTEQLCEQIDMFAAQGIAVMVSTHDPRMVDRFGSHAVYTLLEGRIT